MTKKQRIQKAAAIMALEPKQCSTKEHWEALASALTAAKAVMAEQPVHESDEWALQAISQ